LAYALSGSHRIYLRIRRANHGLCPQPFRYNPLECRANCPNYLLLFDIH
jgi:hypothetical protein